VVKHRLFLIGSIFALPIMAMKEERQNALPLSESFWNNQEAMYRNWSNSKDPLILEMYQEYHSFLAHIDYRVAEIEKQLVKEPNPDGASWFSTVSAACATAVSASWATTKAAARWVELILKDPESEKKAQALIDRILVIKKLQESGDAADLHADCEVQSALERVRGRINTLAIAYRDTESCANKSQLSYLCEYDERIGRVEKNFDRALKVNKNN